MISIVTINTIDSIADFDAWGQASEVLARIADNEEALAFIDSAVEDIFGDGADEVELNDFLAFDAADMLHDVMGINIFADDEEDDEE